jgi:hypothetical protein
MTVSSSIGTSVIGAASIIALRLPATRFFCPGEYSSCNTRLLSNVTKHDHPRLPCWPGGIGVETGPLPNYKPIVKWRATLAKGALATGAARKKAIVAVAPS